MEAIHSITTGLTAWTAGAFFAWALVHGAQKIRRQHEVPVVTFDRPARGQINVLARPGTSKAS